jgi:hypothetical protein
MATVPVRARETTFLQSLIFRLCLFGLLSISCRGALEWENLQVRESAWAGDEKAVAVYRFRNSGVSPITISFIHTSCGCTTVDLAKKTYAAGETGELTATLDIGDRVGEQAKLIMVSTNDNPTKPTTLVFDVVIQQFITCTPRFVYWRIGEPNAPKLVEIVAASSKIVEAVEADSNDPKIAAKVEPLVPGKKYRLWLTPSSTTMPTSAIVTCKAQIDGTRPPSAIIYASVVK